MEPRSETFVQSGASSGADTRGRARARGQRGDEGRLGLRLLGTLTREAQSLVTKWLPGGPSAAVNKAEVQQQAGVRPGALKGSAAGVRLMIRLRHSRAILFGDANLFHDPVWDILLDLYAAELEGRAVSLTSASIASMGPPSTATRWIKLLETRDLVRKGSGGSNGCWPSLTLTEKARDAIEQFLDATDTGFAQLYARS